MEKVVRKGNLFVARGVRMAKYDKKAALQIIVDAAKEFYKKLNYNHFLIVYQESGKARTVCVGFRDMNFLHMTGVKTKLSAQQFYSACIDGKLSENDFEIDNKGKVQQKLTALPYLSELLTIFVFAFLFCLVFFSFLFLAKITSPLLDKI